MELDHYDALIDDTACIFLVLGYNHWPANVRARCIYIPEEERYRKVAYAQEEAARHLPASYRYYDTESLDTVLTVPTAHVVRTIHSRNALAQGVEYLPQEARSFLDRLLKITGIDVESVGLFGSWQVGLAHGGSDVDFVIYGQQNLERFLAQVDRSPYLRSYRSTQKKRLDWARAYSRILGLPVGDIVRICQRTRTNFVIGNMGIDLHFSWLSREAPELTIGRPRKTFAGTCTVTGTNQSLFMPRVYQVETAMGLHTVVTYEHFYMGIADPGERVRLRGTLRENGIITIAKPGEYILPCSPTRVGEPA